MVNVLVNGQGKVYMLNGQALCEANSLAKLTASIISVNTGTAYIVYNNEDITLTTTAQEFTFTPGSSVTFGIKDVVGHGNWYYILNGVQTNRTFSYPSTPITSSFTINSNSTLQIYLEASSCCVPYYTDILCYDGSLKKADHIKVGDKLFGYNVNSQEFTETKVLSVIEVIRNDIFRITTKEGNIIDVTPDHPLLSEDGWTSLNPTATNEAYTNVSISEENVLRVGMKLLNQNGEYEEIKNISQVSLPDNEAIRTYTYNVTDGIDTYITNGFISHNHY